MNKRYIELKEKMLNGTITDREILEANKIMAASSIKPKEYIITTTKSLKICREKNKEFINKIKKAMREE